MQVPPADARGGYGEHGGHAADTGGEEVADCEALFQWAARDALGALGLPAAAGGVLVGFPQFGRALGHLCARLELSLDEAQADQIFEAVADPQTGLLDLAGFLHDPSTAELFVQAMLAARAPPDAPPDAAAQDLYA